jgi:hypothetical protein
VEGAHVSVVQTLPSLQFNGTPTHVPALQVSLMVQRLPSLQGVPLSGVKTQPLAVHVSLVQGLLSLHVDELAHVPISTSHTSAVHGRPSLHPAAS